MNKETLIKLFNSSNEGDVIIAIATLAKLPDPRALFRSFSNEIYTQTEEPELHEIYGKRHEIRSRAKLSEIIYYKLDDDFYIVTNTTSNNIAECFSNYNSEMPVIDLTYEPRNT